MRDAIRRTLALIRKELKAVLNDPRARITLFVPPILQAFLFGYAASYDLTEVPYAVVDQDRSPASREFLASLDGSGIFHRIGNPAGPAEAARELMKRKALVIVQIDQDFQRQLEAGQPARVLVVGDGRNSNTAGIASGYIGTVIDAFNANWRSAHGLAQPSIRVVPRTWYNPNLETRWDMVPPLIATLSLLQTLLLTAMSVAREREQGTFDQLLVTPISPVEIMIGKAVPSMIVGTVQATAILLVATLWFRIPFAGSFVALYLGLLAFLLAAVGVGLFLSSVVTTMQQAMLFAFMCLVPFVLLSGFATPISAMPKSLQTATLVNPMRYGVDLAKRAYLQGADLHALLPDIIPLVIMAAVTLSVAAWMFRHRL